MGFSKGLALRGYTNRNTEDIGAISGSRAMLKYDYFCTSNTCCRYTKSEKKVFVTKSNEYQTFQTFDRKEKVLKVTTSEFITKCPDCGNILYSKRAGG